MQAFTKVGLEALLTPDNCVVLLAAGAQPITWIGMELQRDWARPAGEVTQILLDHAGGSAAAIAWELQLLRARETKNA